MMFEVINRVIHDTSGLYSIGDITNRPCPTITVGVNSVNSLHYKIESYLTNTPPHNDRTYP